MNGNGRAAQVILSWSGGKDSALALARLLDDPSIDVAGLMTTVTPAYDRVSIHGVRRSLLRAQAGSLGLPLYEIELEPVSSNEAYERAFEAAAGRLKTAMPEVDTLVFGDIFLEDVRAYREKLAAATGFKVRFPLWGESTRDLADEVVIRSISARLVCVDTMVLPATFSGRIYDASLIADLPGGIDPCGENGEFHTFVSDGPGFRTPVEYAVGEVVLRDRRFAYCDLLDGN